MSSQEKPIDWYQRGVRFARKVQEGLKEGKTFEEMLAFPPEEAVQGRDLYKKNVDFYNWYKGYISQWD